MRSDLAILKDLIGCEVKTHCGTGGIVTSVSGPHAGDSWRSPGTYTIMYRRTAAPPNDKNWLNTIRVENGVVTCEHRPLKISGKPLPRQLDIFE